MINTRKQASLLRHYEQVSPQATVITDDDSNESAQRKNPYTRASLRDG